MQQMTPSTGQQEVSPDPAPGNSNAKPLKKDKELAVYDAVVALISAGKSFSELTVAEIAREAGIGKGTVYDYFKTKDEIVAKALVFTIKKNVHRARLAVQKVVGFDRRMEAYLTAADEAVQCGMPFFDTLTGCHGLTGGLPQYVNHKEFVQSVRMEAAILLEEIRRAALRERILRRNVPEQLAHFVIAGALASYMLHVNLEGVPDAQARGSIRRQVIRSLKTSLAAM